MGEAKRRKELGVPPREKPMELPNFYKESVQKKVRATLYKYPIIPFLFYGAAILILVGGLVYVFKFYKFISFGFNEMFIDFYLKQYQKVYYEHCEINK